MATCVVDYTVLACEIEKGFRGEISGLGILGQAEFTFFFFFLWPHLWHMEVPGLGVKSGLQLLA